MKPYCKQCGYCCRHHHAFYPNTVKHNEFVAARGWPVIQGNDKQNEVRMNEICPSLDPETNLCRRYRTRPGLCREFPLRLIEEYLSCGLDPNDALPDTCGFKGKL